MIKYPSLSSPRYINRPFRCMIGIDIIIKDIHPCDPMRKQLPILIDKQAKLSRTHKADLYTRQEGYSTHGSRRSWAACNIEIKGIIMYFEAVRFERVNMPQSTFYKKMKEGTI